MKPTNQLTEEELRKEWEDYCKHLGVSPSFETYCEWRDMDPVIKVAREAMFLTEKQLVTEVRLKTK